MAIAQSVASSKKILRNERISHGWFHHVLERHENLALRCGDNTAHSRMNAMNTETVKQYFDLLEDTLKVNGISSLALLKYTMSMKLGCH